MKHFFDTSILIAAFDDQDGQHEAAWKVFVRHADSGVIATHTLSETFSVLTGRRAWRPRDAYEIVSTNTDGLEKITLRPQEYLRTLRVAERLGIRAGAIYDALILACARQAEATSIWTLNMRHFDLFGEELSDRIREP
jgi:predicted nucleic acid-binding protein